MSFNYRKSGAMGVLIPSLISFFVIIIILKLTNTVITYDVLTSIGVKFVLLALSLHLLSWLFGSLRIQLLAFIGSVSFLL